MLAPPPPLPPATSSPPSTWRSCRLATTSRSPPPRQASPFRAPIPGTWSHTPWKQGWAVLRQGKSLFSTQPQASFQNIDVARLAAAVIPSTEQPPRYRLGQEHDALGYPVFAGDQVVGHFQFFDETLLAALNVVAAVVSVPGDLAWLLHAAGGQALEHAGKIAVERSLPPF